MPQYYADHKRASTDIMTDLYPGWKATGQPSVCLNRSIPFFVCNRLCLSIQECLALQKWQEGIVWITSIYGGGLHENVALQFAPGIRDFAPKSCVTGECQELGSGLPSWVFPAKGTLLPLLHLWLHTVPLKTTFEGLQLLLHALMILNRLNLDPHLNL